MNKMSKSARLNLLLTFALAALCLSACSVSRAPEVDKSYAYRTPGDWYDPDALSVYGEGDLSGDIFTLQAGEDASELGAWSPTANWPIGAIHAIVTPDGDILTYGATDMDTSEYGVGGFGVAYDVWDPDEGLGDEAHFTLENQTTTNIFCSAQIIMPNGQILLTGGTGEEGDETQLGVNDVTQFDYLSNDLTTFAPNGSPLTMLKGRWYPTLLTLPNGDQLVHGGRDDTLELNPVIYPEIYSQTTKSWTLLDDPANKEAYEKAYGKDRNDSGWYYPQSWVASDGRVFMLNGFTRDLNYLDVTDGSIERTGYLPAGQNWDHRLGGVMFEQGKILAFANARSAMIIDISEEASLNTIENVGDLEKKRIWGETTVLADGKVLISGGGELDENQEQASADAAVTYTEIWDPKTKEFTKGPSAEQIRLYHSVAILMPNGAVLTAGGGWPGPVDNYNAEIYYPAYLFNDDGSFAERPLLGNVDELEWGKSFGADLNSASTIERVTLVRAPSITHSFDMGQLFFELDFNQSGDTLNIGAPESANVAPPGFYMLFAIDDNGVPSQAQIVSIGATSDEVILNKPGPQTSPANARASLQVLAHDLNGDTLNYSATGLPSGLAIDASSGLISGIPDTEGAYEVEVTVGAGGDSASHEFDWTIGEGVAAVECKPNVQSAAEAAPLGDFEYSNGYLHVPTDASGYGYFSEKQSEHRAEFCVSVDEPGTYGIKGSTSAASEENNSFYVKLDNLDLGVWDTPVTDSFAESYVTQRGAASALSTNLDAGEHRITLYQREKGTRLSKIGLELLDPGEATCGPLAQEAENGVLYGRFELGTDAAASGEQYAGVPADAGFIWQGPASSQARYCVTAPSAGSYELVANASSEGNQDGSFFVTLNGQPSAGHVWDVPVSSSYQESNVSARGQDALRLELKAGPNTLTFHQREAGVRLDSFELVKK